MHMFKTEAVPPNAAGKKETGNVRNRLADLGTTRVPYKMSRERSPWDNRSNQVGCLRKRLLGFEEKPGFGGARTYDS